VFVLVAVTPAGSKRGVMAALGLLAVPTLMVAPVLLYRRPGPSSDSGEGDAGGGGPDAPPPPPPVPRGGIPLPDAEPAGVRERDHDRPRLADRRPLRPSPVPERAPARR